MLIQCAHFPHAKSLCLSRSNSKRQSACHKLAERHPVCYWVTWISTALICLLILFGLNKHVNWKIFCYTTFIVSCIIVFIAAAIVHLRNFGKELQEEFNGAICGQINRYERPERYENNLKQVLVSPTREVGGLPSTPGGGGRPPPRKASSVSFKVVTEECEEGETQGMQDYGSTYL